MDFVIYSIGSGAYLTEVLMAVTSIVGSGDFASLMQIGMILGVIILAFQSLMGGGKEINIGQVATAFLLFALLFGPRVDVAVHGVYDKHDQAVADVPIGIAAPGAMVSQIGLGLTRMFETAFAPLTSSSKPTGLSQGGGFVDSLKVLNTVRRGAADASLLAAVDSDHPGFRESWDQYLRNCTSQKVLRNQATIEEVYNAPFDDVKGMRFNSRIISTPYYESGVDSPTNETCTSAYPKLMAWTDRVSSGGELENAFKRLIQPEGNGVGLAPNDPAPTTASADIGEALDMLGQGAASAQDYVKLALLEPIFIQSMGDRYKDFLDTNTAVMVNQALDQRNTQWAAEQTVFMSVVRPMMTFVEGFAYSIMPFAAFILVLGGFGLKLANKYGQMLLWIQLWLPVLAMTNMYLHEAAATELAQLGNFATSFYALDQADQRLSHWISVGGMLAASTPILTLVLLTGSTYAMTSLAGRMQGADHVNEKVASPDALQTGAVMNHAAMQQHSAGAGRVMSGAESSLLNFQVGQMAQSSVQSARQEQMQASESLTGSMQQSFKQGETLTSSHGRTELFNSALSSSSAEGATAMSSAADQMAKELGLNKSQSDQLRAEMAFNANASTPVKDLLVGMGISANSSQAQSFSLDQSVSEAVSSTTGVNWSDSHSAQLSEALSHQVSGMSSEQLAKSWGSENVSSIQEAASEVRSASDSYQEAEMQARSLSSSESVRADRLGQMVTSTEGLAGKLSNQFNATATPEMKAAANDRAARYADPDGYGMSQENAVAVAQMEQLYNGDQAHQSQFMDILSESTGASYGGMPGADAGMNDGVAGDIRTPGEAGAGAHQGAPSPSGSLGVNGDRGLVESHYDYNKDEVEQHHEINQAGQAKERVSNAISSLGEEPSTSSMHQLRDFVMSESTSADAIGGGFVGASDGGNVLAGNSGWFGLGDGDSNSAVGSMKEAMLGNNDLLTARDQEHAAGSLGLPVEQATAFGYGAMSQQERQAFDASGKSVDLSTPAQQAAFSAGEAHRESGGSMSAASAAYDQGRLENAASYYEERYDSPGVGAVAAALHTTNASQREALLDEGTSTIAQEAAAAEGVDYHSLDADERSRYDNYATNMASSVAMGLQDGGREGAARAAEAHSEVVRLSKN